jgi:GTPase Era involved in 16S rRNA processing
MTQPLKVAVVGHTNTGKTSLMRTLMRDVDFGEVSDHPAVTRSVQGALLYAHGEPAIELFDTPGLEDSIGLAETLDAVRDGRRIDGVDVVREFLDSDAARQRFSQEAKAIRQVLEVEAALYVVDARDRVHGKHRDELEILGMCARPIVPVLNFTADPHTQTATWREHLSRVNMHAVAEFDTVAFDARDEQRLFEKMATMLDEHRSTLEALIEDRRDERRSIIRSSATIVAELIVDAAAFVIRAPSSEKEAEAAALERLKDTVRSREQQCVDRLLTLHRFREHDVASDALPIENGTWGVDLFSREAMKQFSTFAGGGAAAGAMVGLTLDAMLAGLSLGTGAAAGAAIGGLLGGARTHGRRLYDRARGMTELRCDDATLSLLALRQLALVRALLHRGHASMRAVELAPPKGRDDARRLPREIRDVTGRARAHPGWSSLAPATRSIDPARDAAVEQLAAAFDTVLANETADRH